MEEEEQEEKKSKYSSTRIKVGKKAYYMDGYLQQNLTRAKERIKEDWDMVGVYDGYEGSGKSVKAMQDCFYMDHSFDLSRVCFTSNEFQTAVGEAKKGQAVLYDEAFTGMSSREAMGRINRSLMKMLAEIRQKNLFLAITMPTFFDLDKYAALWRSRYLVHVYTDKNSKRGYFAFYNQDRKKSLYVTGKKFYNYYKPHPNFRGRFLQEYVVDEKAYRKKKADSLAKRTKDEVEERMRKEVQAELFARLVEDHTLTQDHKANILGIPRTTYRLWETKYKEDKI